MKAKIFDGLQMILAILITGTLVANAAPVPTDSNAPQQAKAVEVVKDAPVTQKPQEAPKIEATEPKIEQEPAPEPVEEPVAQPVAAAPAPSSNDCEAWIAQAGITDRVNARELIRRESGCNPRAVNPTSGACGVAQELPCGKSQCGWDGACQVRWMNSYVLGRYGSWANAIAFHNANNWY